MKAIIVLMSLWLAAMPALANPVAKAIEQLQVSAGMRQTALNGALVLVLNSLGTREEVTIPGFLPVPPGKVLVISRIDSLSVTGEIYLRYWSPQWGAGGGIVFNFDNDYSWTGHLTLQEGGTLEMSMLVAPPPTYSLVAAWMRLEEVP